MKLKNIIKNLPGIMYIVNTYIYYSNKYQYLKNPKKLANKSYLKVFKKNINWECPKDLIEKIIWMQFNSDTSLWSELADKYKVRSYIKKICPECKLPELYGKYTNANQIDFESLPKQFVIKTNNGCGSVIIVRDKSKINIRKINKTLNKWLKLDYGYINAQSHYLRIPKCIIIEEFLSDKEEHTTLKDYKFWCFNGKPETCLVVSDRNILKHKYKLSLYDVNWNNISYNIKKCLRSDENIEKPKNYELMLKYCQKITRNIPCVRLDLYNINGKIYFGELTFTSGFGSYNIDFYNYLGSKFELPVNL